MGRSPPTGEEEARGAWGCGPWAPSPRSPAPAAAGKRGCEPGFRAASPRILAPQLLLAKAGLGSLEGAVQLPPRREEGREGGREARRGRERGRDFPRGSAGGAARGGSGEGPRGALSAAAGAQPGLRAGEAPLRCPSAPGRRAPPPLTWAEGTPGEFRRTRRHPPQPQVPGSRGDQGARLSQPGTGKRKPGGRLPGHPAVSPRVHGAAFGVPGSPESGSPRAPRRGVSGEVARGRLSASAPGMGREGSGPAPALRGPWSQAGVGPPSSPKPRSART